MSQRVSIASLLRFVQRAGLALVLALLTAESASPHEISLPGLGALAMRLGTQLGASWQIHVVIAETNERMVSVERLRDPDERFVVTFDRKFLADLDEGEITAALAHEIGHIWIFSHFPYLHTEVLANEVALNLVERDDLERLYIKLQAHLGAAQSVEDFLASNIPARNHPISN